MKKTEFPEHLAFLRRLMPELVRIMETGKEDTWYAFAWLEEKRTMTAQVHRSEYSADMLDRGIVLRILACGENFEIASNRLEPDHLRGLAHGLRHAVEQAPLNQDAPRYEPWSWSHLDRHCFSSFLLEQLPEHITRDQWVHFGVDVRDDYESQITCAALLDQARVLRSALQETEQHYCEQENAKRCDKAKLEALVLFDIVYRHQSISYVFVDRHKNISQQLPISLAMATGFSATGVSNRGMQGGMGDMTVAVFDDEAMREAAIVPHQLSEAERLTSGSYPVITGPDVTGVLAHEAFGHTQEGDTCRALRSCAPRLRSDNTRVGNDQASIINDPGLFQMADKQHGTNGSYFFDHEGQLAFAQVILDRGFLCDPMCDIVSALHLNVPRTANGKRESWRRPMMSRQTNTYFTAGDKTLDDLIAMVKGQGFLAKVSHGGMEDPKGMNLTAGAAYLEEIVDGKLTGRVFVGPSGGHVELNGYVPDLLNSIVAKSKVDEHSSQKDRCAIPENKYGGCGKYHKELVFAGCGGPYILWDRMPCG